MNIEKLKNIVIWGDCLKVMPLIPGESIDMVLADLPYGITNNSWDKQICLQQLWDNYLLLIKDRSPLVFTASQPFASRLISSNEKMFKCEWIWEKDKAANVLNANRQCLKIHENILVFYKRQCVYNPQMVKLDKPYAHKNRSVLSSNFGDNSKNYDPDNYKIYTHSYPKSLQRFVKDTGTLNPTQKPQKLFEYFIKTYSNEGDIILDNVAGALTTARACIGTNRNFICIEKRLSQIKAAKEKYAELKDIKVFKGEGGVEN